MEAADLRVDVRLRGSTTVVVVICSCGDEIIRFETEDFDVERLRSRPENAEGIVDAFVGPVLGQAVSQSGVTAMICNNCGRYLPLDPARQQ